MHIPTVLIWGSTLLAASSLRAQAPPAPDTTHAIDAAIGNEVLQLRYLTDTPLTGVRSNLDYGVLLSENRELGSLAPLEGCLRGLGAHDCAVGRKPPTSRGGPLRLG